MVYDGNFLGGDVVFDVIGFGYDYCYCDIGGLC